jgi:ketosteroid isomerase-like protein
MRTRLRTFLPLILFTVHAAAQAPASRADEFLKLEKAWAAALQRRDTATLDRLMAAEWRQVQPSGKIQSKTELLAALQSAEQGAESVEITGVEVMDFGDMVQVLGRVVEKSTVTGQEREGEYVFADLFTWREGRWQAVYSHTTRVVKP